MRHRATSEYDAVVIGLGVAAVVLSVTAVVLVVLVLA